MFKLLILLAIATSALGAAIPDGAVPQVDGRIIGGTGIPITTSPWTVSIERDGAHACGGSVLYTNVVITAAHCVAGSKINALKVRIESSTVNMDGYLVSVYDFKYHEGYNPVTMENDIAVVRMTSSTSYNTRFRNLDIAYSTPANGVIATVTGWGSLTYGGTASETLQLAAVNIISEANCRSNVYGYGSQIKSTMICAAGTGKDACQLDSGGPLAAGGYLVGIVSWGIGCANANYPGIYTNTAVLRNWIITAAASI